MTGLRLSEEDLAALIEEKNRLVRENFELRQWAERWQSTAQHWNVKWQEERDGRQQDVLDAIADTVERWEQGIRAELGEWAEQVIKKIRERQ